MYPPVHNAFRFKKVSHSLVECILYRTEQHKSAMKGYFNQLLSVNFNFCYSLRNY